MFQAQEGIAEPNHFIFLSWCCFGVDSQYDPSLYTFLSTGIKGYEGRVEQHRNIFENNSQKGLGSVVRQQVLTLMSLVGVE